MKIISFAWTVDALVQGKKTQTRRLWQDKYAKQFKKGDLVQAYDKNPRAGGKLIAIIRLTKKPFKQFPCHMTEAEFIAEGGTMYWKDLREFVQLMQDRSCGASVWVIEFELVAVKYEHVAS